MIIILWILFLVLKYKWPSWWVPVHSIQRCNSKVFYICSSAFSVVPNLLVEVHMMCFMGLKMMTLYPPPPLTMMHTLTPDQYQFIPLRKGCLPQKCLLKMILRLQRIYLLRKFLSNSFRAPLCLPLKKGRRNVIVLPSPIMDAKSSNTFFLCLPGWRELMMNQRMMYILLMLKHFLPLQTMFVWVLALRILLKSSEKILKTRQDMNQPKHFQPSTSQWGEFSILSLLQIIYHRKCNGTKFFMLIPNMTTQNYSLLKYFVTQITCTTFFLSFYVCIHYAYSRPSLSQISDTVYTSF